MKKRRIVTSILSFLLCMLPLAACTPGHLGTNVVAFLRDGNLWTMDPNGANAFEVAGQATPIVGYSWSPSHQILSFRALDPDFAKTNSAHHLVSNAITGLIGDVPGSENTIGVDGGEPIVIAFSSADTAYSNTFWNNNSTRLLYRQSPAPTQSEQLSPLAATWPVSQSDQPGGIALKELPRTFSIPTVSYDSTNYLVIGDAPQGLFSTTLAGTGEQMLLHQPLPGHPLPATLERILWRPQHQNESFVYAIDDQPATTQIQLTTPPTVKLILRTLAGQTRLLATCTCTQFAWSPDGSSLLYTTGTDYTLLNLDRQTSFHFSGEMGSVPYWSPDSSLLLLQGPQTLQLIAPQSHQTRLLLTDQAGLSIASAIGKTSSPTQIPTDILLQPVANSLWAPDSRHFLFLASKHSFWQGKQISTGKGLYTISLDDNGQPQGQPALIDTGNDSQPGWTYADPNTSFLF